MLKTLNILAVHLSANFVIALCRLDANFLRDGNAIISKNTLQLQVYNCSCSRSFNTDDVGNMLQTLSFDYRIAVLRVNFVFSSFLGFLNIH